MNISIKCNSEKSRHKEILYDSVYMFQRQTKLRHGVKIQNNGYLEKE